MRIKMNWLQVNCPVPYCKAFLSSVLDGELQLIVGQEPKIGWHMSISHSRRYPTWNEIKEARYKFCPDEVTMAMILPPKSEYVNVHPTTFHLHQISGDD